MPPKTAAELLAELESDPNWIDERAARDAAFEAETARLRAAEQPVLAALRQVGVNVPEVWSLLEGDRRYPEAIPILLEHLARPYPPAIREGLARALGTPDARPIWHAIAARYVAETDEQVKDALATAVAATVTDMTLDDLLRLIADPQHGSSRVLLLTAKLPVRALPALELLVDDSDLRLELLRIVKRLRSRSRRAGGRVGSPPMPIDPTLSEASMSHDRATVGQLLSRIVDVGIGITRADTRTIRRMIDDLDLDEEREVRFEIRTDGGASPLVVRAYLDDPHSVDLYFFGPEALVDAVQTLLEASGEDQLR